MTEEENKSDRNIRSVLSVIGICIAIVIGASLVEPVAERAHSNNMQRYDVLFYPFVIARVVITEVFDFLWSFILTRLLIVLGVVSRFFNMACRFLDSVIEAKVRQVLERIYEESQSSEEY